MASREGRREAFTGETTGQVLSCETGLLPRCRSRSAEEKATSAHDVAACMGRTSRSRRPCARGEVLCAEPGRSHPRPDLCRAGSGRQKPYAEHFRDLQADCDDRLASVFGQRLEYWHFDRLLALSEFLKL